MKLHGRRILPETLPRPGFHRVPPGRCQVLRGLGGSTPGQVGPGHLGQGPYLGRTSGGGVPPDDLRRLVSFEPLTLTGKHRGPRPAGGQALGIPGGERVVPAPGLLLLPHIPEDLDEVSQGAGGRRGTGCDPSQRVFALLPAAQKQEADRNIVEGRGVVGVALEEPSIRIDRGLRVVLHRALVVRLGQPCLAIGQSAPKLVRLAARVAHPLGIEPLVAQDHRDLPPRHGELRVQLHGLLQEGEGLELSPLVEGSDRLGIEAERVERCGGGLGQPHALADRAEGFAGLLPDLAGQTVDAAQELIVRGHRDPEGPEHLARLGGHDGGGQEVSASHRGDLSLDHGLEPVAQGQLPGGARGEGSIGWKPHAGHARAHVAGRRQLDDARFLQVHPERLGDHVAHAGVGGVCEVGEDDELALLEESLGHQVPHRPDPGRPHDEVRGDGQSHESHGADAAQDGVPPGEEPLEARRGCGRAGGRGVAGVRLLPRRRWGATPARAGPGSASGPRDSGLPDSGVESPPEARPLPPHPPARRPSPARWEAPGPGPPAPCWASSPAAPPAPSGSPRTGARPRRRPGRPPAPARASGGGSRGSTASDGASCRAVYRRRTGFASLSRESHRSDHPPPAP
jgi:hypothetical protein